MVSVISHKQTCVQSWIELNHLVSSTILFERYKQQWILHILDSLNYNHAVSPLKYSVVARAFCRDELDSTTISYFVSCWLRLVLKNAESTVPGKLWQKIFCDCFHYNYLYVETLRSTKDPLLTNFKGYFQKGKCAIIRGL